MESKETSNNKPIKRMTKAELLIEVKRQRDELLDSKLAIENQFDSADLLKVEAERDEWMEKAMHQEEKLARHEAMKKEIEEKIRKERRSKDKQVIKLESRVNELNTQLKEKKNKQEPSLDSKHKSSFRLEYYPQGEGEIQGKIEHMISRKKQILIGLDEKKLIDFIKIYVSHLFEENEEQDKLASSSPTKEKGHKKLAKYFTDSENTSVFALDRGELEIKNIGQRKPSKLINKRKRTQVSIPLNSLGIDHNVEAYQWEAQLFSKSMRRLNEIVRLGNYNGKEIKGDNIVFEFSANYMQPGPNRVRASLSLFKIENERRIQHGSFDMSGLAYVQ